MLWINLYPLYVLGDNAVLNVNIILVVTIPDVAYHEIIIIYIVHYAVFKYFTI